VSIYWLITIIVLKIDSCSPCDNQIEKFEVETIGVCGAMIKHYDEMTTTDAFKHQYRDGRVPFVNYETNEKGYA
jgi:hypothetical protein